MTLAELYPDAVDRLGRQPLGRPLVVAAGGAWLALRYGGAGQIEASWRTSWRDALDDARQLARLPVTHPWALAPRGRMAA